MKTFDGHNDVLSRLHQAGVGDEAFLEGGGALERVAHGNWLRVLRAAWGAG